MEKDGFIEIEFSDHSIKTYQFKDIKSHSGSSRPNGLMIWLKEGHIFYPWVQIHSVYVKVNSDGYVGWKNAEDLREEAESMEVHIRTSPTGRMNISAPPIQVLPRERKWHGAETGDEVTFQWCQLHNIHQDDPDHTYDSVACEVSGNFRGATENEVLNVIHKINARKGGQ